MKNTLIGLLLLILSSVAVAKDVDREFREAEKEFKQFMTLSKRAIAVNKTSVDKLVDSVCQVDVEKKASPEAKLVERMVASVARRVDTMKGEIAKKYGEASRTCEQFRQDFSGAEYKGQRQKCHIMEGKMKKQLKTVVDAANGQLRGANDPKFKALIAYGEKKHREFGGRCDLTEKVVGNVSGNKSGKGRLDCLMLRSCEVVDFKPTHWSGSSNYASRYLPGVKAMFETANTKNGRKKLLQRKGMTDYKIDRGLQCNARGWKARIRKYRFKLCS